MKPYHQNQTSPRVLRLKPTQPKEKQEQIALIQWATLESKKHPELSLLVHIPNGGYRLKSEAVSLQRQGVSPGFPDLFLPVPRFPFHGLFLELKTSRGRVTPYQAGWLKALSDKGYRAVVARGFEGAKEEIEEYLCLA
jgi:hypothetical protein